MYPKRGRKRQHSIWQCSSKPWNSQSPAPTPPPAKVSTNQRRHLSFGDVAPDEQLDAVIKLWMLPTAPGAAASGIATVLLPSNVQGGGEAPIIGNRLLLLRQADVTAAYGALAPKCGDRLRLIVRRDHSSSIANCQLLRLSRRDCAEWLKFVEHLLEIADKINNRLAGCGRLIAEFGDPEAVWSMALLGDCGLCVDARLGGAVCRLLTALERLLASRPGAHGKWNVVMETASSQTTLARFLTPLLAADAAESSNSSSLVSMHRRILIDFARCLLAHDPGCLSRLLPLLRAAPMSPSNGLLLDLLTAVADMRPDGRRSTSIMPTSKEVSAGRSSMLTGLKPARIDGPYQSVEDYFDTMFRLLRADCFEQFQQCMDQVKSGTLNHKLDIRIYCNVKVRSIRLCRGGASCIGVTFDLLDCDRAPRDWAKSMRLMTGNLLCLARDEQFTEQYWATVAERDCQDLNSQRLVWLELRQYMSNSELTAGDVLVSLLLNSTNASGGFIMLESPTMFRAFEPVLETLKSFDAEKFPFADALVLGDMSAAESQPAYVKRYYGELEAENSNAGGMVGESPLNLPFISTGNLLLDSCQTTAFENVFRRRIYVCQGPPGTGKTLLGVLIARQLLKLEVLQDRPILVLCYKNHALDEFLSHLLPEHEDDIARIGGRCKDPRLEHLNLLELRRRNPDRSKTHSLHLINSQIAEASKNFESTLKRLDWLFAHPAVAILDECNATYLARITKHIGRSSSSSTSRGSHPVAQPETELKVKRASKDELRELIWSDSKAFSILSACVDRSMPAIAAQLHANQPRRLKISAMPAAATNSNPESRTATAVDEVDEDEIKERENQILSSLASRESRSGNSAVDKTHLKFINSSRIVHDPDLEKCCTSGLIAHLSQQDPTRLTPTEQLLFFQQAFYKAVNKLREEVKKSFNIIQTLESERRLIEVTADAAILRRRRIIGMTITGASIHKELLDLVQPGVLLVEEAAEVTEPHLLACIGHQTEQLILIGDHMQLRPQVECYALAKDYHLDVSMMERLISRGIKYDQLELQSRMKPEFSLLLRDIYPNLRDNLAVVGTRQLIPQCLTRSMFFWTHSKQETAALGHGAVNMEEAQRCIHLAVFLITQGCPPARITILSAYRRQTTLIRQLFKEFAAKSDFLATLFKRQSNQNFDEQEFNEAPMVESKAEISLKIFTIDLYQGDENDIVIVSLVRSNPSKKIGFLRALNRRCVAQSRARLAMIFIGNADCIYESPEGKTWRYLLDGMKNASCVGPKLSLCCPNHSQTVVQSESYEQIPIMSSFCKETCGILMSCELHHCQQLCQPPHDLEHDNCKVVVPFQHPGCGHSDTKFCSESISSKTCKEKVSMQFANCSHVIEKMCGVPDSYFNCTKPCERLLACGHKCLLKCHELCSNRACQEKIPFEFPCGYTVNTKCHEDRQTLTCQLACNRKLPCSHPCLSKCGELCNLKPCLVQTVRIFRDCDHSIQVPCYISEQQLVCKAKCERKLTCGHSCPSICSVDCASVACQVKISFVLPCTHTAKRACSTPESQVSCEALCKKPLEGCGHPCQLQCCQACNSKCCKICAEVQADAEKEQTLMLQQAIRRSALQELAKLRARKDSLPTVRTLTCADDLDEYLDVHDRVMNFIQPEHGWHPAITKIEKVESVKLTSQYLDFKAKLAVEPGRSEKKFHGTSADALQSILNEGFKLPNKAGMYGAGIYFATNSSKSSQPIYTKGSNMLLLCDVLIGKSLKVTSATQEYRSHADLKQKGYDSLFAPRNTKSSGGVLFDEFVIFDPRQAVPQYVIHYSNQTELPNLSLPSSTHNQILKIRPSRYKTDGNSCESLHFASVQSEYLRIDGTASDLGSITEVWVNRNPQLEYQFQAKQTEFLNKYNNSAWVYAFHGTKKANADSIFKENFRLDKCVRKAYGEGIYFSEFTRISKDYGDALLLCKVLLGKEVSHPPPADSADFDCVRVEDATKSEYCAMLVISDPDQIMPLYRVFTDRQFSL